MAREPTFTCQCGATAEQSKRGVKRIRCPECQHRDKSKWMADYHQRRKNNQAPQAQA